MPFSFPRRAGVSAAIALSISAVSAQALASESLEIKSGTQAYFDGTVLYKKITVRSGGTLVVRSVGSGGTGTVTLKAEEVVVEAGGKIDATGAGYGGTSGDGGTPACCPAAAGAVGPAGMNAPGGGGGNGGKGAPGCPNGGKGGEAYASFDNAYPGAAGGASSHEEAGAADIPTDGGRGGGSVTIVAASVTIEGEILADGVSGSLYGGVGSGAGAGGVIRIDAASLQGAGLLSARGGSNTQAYSGIGGGGGGGVIHISLPVDAPMDLLPTREVFGGLTGMGTCASGDDGVDELVPVMDKPCTDADGDGHRAESCGGDDCDDGDTTVFGGSSPALEVCDAQDNDCNGSVDDDLVTDACPAGQSCQAGECVGDGGAGGGGGGGGSSARPEYVDYRGACAVGPAGAAGAGGAAFFGLAVAGLLSALARRRR